MPDAAMRRGISILLLLVFLVCTASVVSAKDGRDEEAKRRPIVVIAQQQHGREIYKVDSVAAHDLLRTLGLLIEKRGPDYPVIVLLDWNSPVSGIFDVPAIASKAGFKDVRVFVFDSRDKRYISEIRSEPGMPYSDNPQRGFAAGKSITVAMRRGTPYSHLRWSDGPYTATATPYDQVGRNGTFNRSQDRLTVTYKAWWSK